MIHQCLCVLLVVCSHLACADQSFLQRRFAESYGGLPAGKNWTSFQPHSNYVSLRNSSKGAKTSQLANKRGVHSLGHDCDRPEVAAALASLAMYDTGIGEAFLPAADVTVAKNALTAAGFSIAKEYANADGKCHSLVDPNVIVDDHDASFLWKRSDGHCLLAFRGSNCYEGGRDWLKDTRHIFKYGHDIHQHVLVDEFEPLLKKMSKADFTDCATLDVTGHSLGASLASIFAVLSNADELQLEKYVDRVYLFSTPAVFFGGGARNGRREDGCFPGAQYCYYIEENGEFKADFACHLFEGGFQHPKSDYIRIGATTGTTACADVTEQVFRGDAVTTRLADHLPQHYLNGQGCSDAQIPVRQG